MNKEQNENLGNQLAFQNHMKSFQNKIERAILMLIDFLSQLQEVSPDLGKMNDIDAKINLVITQIEEQWNKMQKMIYNLRKALRLYGDFIIEVLLENGEELLNRSRHLKTQNNKMKIKTIISLISNENIGQESQLTFGIVSLRKVEFSMLQQFIWLQQI